MDEDGNQKVSTGEFERGLDDGRVQAILRTLDVEPRHALDLFLMLDDGTGEVDIEEFICACVNFQGYAKAIQMEQFRVHQHQLTQRIENADVDLKRMREICQSILPWMQMISATEFRSEFRT